MARYPTRIQLCLPFLKVCKPKCDVYKSGCRNGAPDPRMTKITSALKPDRTVIFMSQTGRHILEPNGLDSLAFQHCLYKPVSQVLAMQSTLEVFVGFVSTGQGCVNGNQRMRPNEGSSSQGNDNPARPFMTFNNRLTALVVENGVICRILQKGLLTAFGVETEAVSCGIEAEELIFCGASFNLIVIGMHLIGMTAIEVAQKLRYMGVRSKMLGITANYSEEEKQEFLEAGGDVYFEKPLSPYKFIPILEDIDMNM